MSTRRHWFLACISLVLASCGGSSRKSGPPTISYGNESCARCGMLISDERHAAALVAADVGSQLKFDDTGELVATVQEHGLADRLVWVHDFIDSTWLNGLAARYVIDPNRNTPMGSGVIAFATESAATSWLAGSTSSILSWTELLGSWQLTEQ